MTDNDALAKARADIDRIDQEIQRLLNERAQCALTVAKVKSAHESNPVFYRPEREAQVLRGVMERNKGPLSNESMARLFREIMSACLALERPMRIAYLGPEGTYTQAAALKHFGHSVNTVAQPSIKEVFRAMDNEAADYGVVPIENTSEGVVNHTLDQFMRSSLKVCGEVALPIHHNLLTNAKSFSDVRVVMAHPQALAQCRAWLAKHVPNAEQVPCSSNSEAAKTVADRDDAAAIASDEAATLYGLNILQANIEDEANNMTRFLVIGRQSAGVSGKDKTAIMVSAKNKPGALVSLLQPIAQQGVSMTRIESRPSRQAQWEYVFFLDLDGHQDDEPVRAALNAIEEEAAMLKVLGSFPKAPL